MDNDPDVAPSIDQQGQRGQEDDGKSFHTASQPPPYNALHTHAGHGQSLGHSVVPDLMKIYESLTQSKTPHTHHQQQSEPQYQQPSVQQPPQQVYQANHFYPPAQAAVPTYPYMQAHGQAFNYAQPSEMPTQQYASADYEGTTNQNTTGRSLRKRTVDKVEDDRCSSDGSTSRSRKKRKSDGRWAKRFTWPDELHRDFVSAIFDVGLKHASPSALLEHMPEHDQITSERVKSHLQKYRMHRAKSKKEFMSCYEATLNNYQVTGAKSKSLGSGEVAAHLAYSTMIEPEETSSTEPIQGQPNLPRESANDMFGTSRGGALILPKLTEAEKKSPMGASLGYLMGLFFSLRQQLLANRAAAASSVDGADPSTLTNQVPLVSYPSSAADAEHVDREGQLHDQNMAVWSGPPGHTMDASQYQDQQATSKTSTAAAQLSQASTSRTNLEESHLMKREMQSQMAFQNKMRALKQQELNKTKNVSNDADHHCDDIADDSGDAPQANDVSRIKHDEDTSKEGPSHDDHDGAFQEMGEAAEAGNGQHGVARPRHRGLSMGASEDFWVNDEQLFEFLMNS